MRERRGRGKPAAAAAAKSEREEKKKRGHIIAAAKKEEGRKEGRRTGLQKQIEHSGGRKEGEEGKNIIEARKNGRLEKYDASATSNATDRCLDSTDHD